MKTLSARSLARIVTAAYAVALVLGVIVFHPGCVNLVVWASFEKFDLLRDVAARYQQTRPSVDSRCVTIDVRRVASGEAEESLARAGGTVASSPDIWSPAARTWLRLLERDRALAGASSIVPSAETSILQSPLVIGMPEPMAAALGWPRADISWKDIFALARDPQGWSARGHSEWGRFKLAKTNPLISTSGVHALMATYLMSGGASIDDPQVLAFMRSVEASVVHYGSTVSSFLLNLAEADDRGEALTYVSAIAMEEKQVWDYNQGNPESKTKPTRLPPTTKLVAIYPTEGTLLADHPFVVMPWADDQKRRAAGHFLDHLKSDAVQAEFMTYAFRGARGETGKPIDESPELNRFKQIIYFALPDPKTLEQVQSSWSSYRKRARVLFVLDAAESMADRVAPAAASKLDLAKDAWNAALDGLVSDDDVGLWALAGVERRKLVEVGPLRDQRGTMRSELAALAPHGTGKALYAAIADALAAQRQRFARDRINAVVLLTDGRNDDPTNNDLNGLLRALRAQAEDERVRVFTIAYGPAADREALERIAHAGRGTFYDAKDPSVINRLILDVVSSF